MKREGEKVEEEQGVVIAKAEGQEPLRGRLMKWETGGIWVHQNAATTVALFFLQFKLTIYSEFLACLKADLVSCSF